MSQLDIAVKQIKAFRDYMKSLSAPAKGKPYCYLLTKEEIYRLLHQKGDGTSLDGLRVYLGAESINDQMVPTIQVVAVEKEEGSYNDYKIPSSELQANAETMSVGQDSTPVLGNPYPCPTHCSQSNILNQ